MEAAEVAARRYVDAWNERDRDARQALLEAGVASTGRCELPGRSVRGRAALAEVIEASWADPAHRPIRITSVVDLACAAFRFRVTSADGRALLEVGELDHDGRIAAMYTFVEPLAAAEPSDPAGGLADRAVRTYVELWSARDPAARRQMLAACFARDARFVVATRTFHGHDEIAAMVDRALADPRGLHARRTTRIDDLQTAFRFGSVGTYDDGSPPFEGLDVGEVDGDGRIAVLYAFNRQLRDADPATSMRLDPQ